MTVTTQSGLFALMTQRARAMWSLGDFARAGAEQVISAIHKNPASKNAYITELLGAGDIDRIIIEWRSMLRQSTQHHQRHGCCHQDVEDRCQAASGPIHLSPSPFRRSEIANRGANS